MSFLVLVRHGESMWNLANKFTGWVDVPLSEKGIEEALTSAEELSGLTIDIAFTSKLMRAHQTLLTILSKQKKTGIFLHEGEHRSDWALHPNPYEDQEIPIFSSDAINERFYGELQGKNKDEARKEFGEEQVFVWRRSWDIAPPEGESLKDTYERSVPYFEHTIMSYVKKGYNVIVSAHGNSLRAIIKLLDNISDEEIPHLNLPTGKPLTYRYEDGKLIKDWDHVFDRPTHW